MNDVKRYELYIRHAQITLTSICHLKKSHITTEKIPQNTDTWQVKNLFNFSEMFFIICYLTMELYCTCKALKMVEVNIMTKVGQALVQVNTGSSSSFLTFLINSSCFHPEAYYFLNYICEIKIRSGWSHQHSQLLCYGNSSSLIWLGMKRDSIMDAAFDPRASYSSCGLNVSFSTDQWSCQN